MNTSRSEGCTLSGALSVTTAIHDAVTIIHGPAGCAHHNVSLFHALLHERDVYAMPRIRCTDLREREVVFGGEDVLEDLLRKTAHEAPGSIFVLSTCVVDTIGDDLLAVCSRDYGVPVCYIPTSGFLGGVFHRGYENALLALSVFSERKEPDGNITLIGEKNLEYEVEENFLEVLRLVEKLGARVGLRYVRNIRTGRLADLGAGSLNILRDPSIEGVGREFRSSFGTPYLESFPEGFSETLRFLEKAAEYLGADPENAIDSETALQKKVIGEFGDLAGRRVCFTGTEGISEIPPVVDEIARIFDLCPDEKGISLRVPDPVPVGTAGMSRLLHRWRRACRAGA